MLSLSSVILHAMLAVLWYGYSGLVIEFVNFLNQNWIVSTIIFLISIALFAYLYATLMPKRLNTVFGWLAGFFPVLAILMFFVY